MEIQLLRLYLGFRVTFKVNARMGIRTRVGLGLVFCIRVRIKRQFSALCYVKRQYSAIKCLKDQPSSEVCVDLCMSISCICRGFLVSMCQYVCHLRLRYQAYMDIIFDTSLIYIIVDVYICFWMRNIFYRIIQLSRRQMLLYYCTIGCILSDHSNLLVFISG